MKIGILQTGHVPEDLAQRHGEYPEMFSKFLEGKGFEFEAHAVVDGRFPASIFAADGWLITGSRHGAYEDHAWIPPLENFIRESYSSSVPLVGVCFGHQIMAQALGGSVERFGGIWGVGNRDYDHHDGETRTLLAMHQDQVVKKPAEATVIATSDYCKNAAFMYKGRAYSVQPHPEFNREFIRELIEQRAGTVIPHDQASEGLATLDRENDAPKFADDIAAFFRNEEKQAAE